MQTVCLHFFVAKEFKDSFLHDFTHESKADIEAFYSKILCNTS